MSDVAEFTDKGVVIITGDLNSRCGLGRDFIESDVLSRDLIDSLSSVFSYVSDVELVTRRSEDKVTNSFGRGIENYQLNQHKKMAGLRKQKKYDWKDSNLALFGSDTEREVKKESAQTEPAWNKAGEKVGLQIWRIEKFKVKHWPKNEYGQFYNGDSYIILNTYKEPETEALLYDVHFWIGKYSTQDEYGTAAYKTVELDTLLDDVPVQHREVQGHESSLFKSYFKEMTILNGGVDSGFNHVKPEEYKPRLLHVHGEKKISSITVTQIRRDKSKIDDTDVYILDAGLTIYQWNGKGANAFEKRKAQEYVTNVKSNRTGKAVKSVVIDQEASSSDDEDLKEFEGYLDGGEEDESDDSSDFVQVDQSEDKTKMLFRLSDAGGSMEFSLEKSGNISMDDFDTKDVFIFDSKSELFVWIGKATSDAEKKNAIVYAHNYLQKSKTPLLPVSCFKEGGNTKALISALAA
ncbi:hypothetical protein FSP39_002220 [Pinctada imbricata]|uniref:Actin-modulator n=1 Tax=Pinctada imbricata TaxID=66713 RepID=A0AA88YAC5_PINIB|nr:hypothetical protein FSP39_002220 [Pinctada imbricata]